MAQPVVGEVEGLRAGEVGEDADRQKRRRHDVGAIGRDAWNRGPLGPLAGHPLKDKRVRVEVGDVADTLRGSIGRFDAVLLDVDNGPAAFTASDNAGLYDDATTLVTCGHGLPHSRF